ncbi:MAG: dihydroorotase [Bacteroidetes bacterium 46-16]|nr:MAG: dihydroorotase [Bacteroidetes bacterium 46-16]
MLVLIRGAKVSDPASEFHGKVTDILLEDGIIKTVKGSIKTKADTVIEAAGLNVSPGWVDVLADYSEPGYEHKETIASGLNAAAAGGFTDVLLSPNTNPVTGSKSTVQYLLQKAKGHIVNLHPLGVVSTNAEGKTLAEMLDMHSNGALAFTDGWKPIQSAGLMLKALEYVRAFNGVVLQLPVDVSLAEGGQMHEGPVSTKLGMAGIPVMAESLVIHRDIELLRYTGSRLHITGVSTAEGLALIRQAKGEGLDISCSVTPYHLALTDESLNTYSSLYKVSPPLRPEADRQALIAGLNDGTIDCIASHHRPQDWDAKEKEFEYASNGMNLQEISFQVTWNAVAKEVALDKLVAALSSNPRRIFGLPGGNIKEGGQAALTVFSADASFSLQEDKIRSASRNNPFTGKELKGNVVGVINKGNVHLNK